MCLSVSQQSTVLSEDDRAGCPGGSELAYCVGVGQPAPECGNFVVLSPQGMQEGLAAQSLAQPSVPSLPPYRMRQNSQLILCGLSTQWTCT